MSGRKQTAASRYKAYKSRKGAVAKGRVVFADIEKTKATTIVLAPETERGDFSRSR